MGERAVKQIKEHDVSDPDTGGEAGSVGSVVLVGQGISGFCIVFKSTCECVKLKLGPLEDVLTETTQKDETAAPEME